ncbi:MAG: hypothetical protein GQ583_01145 [Methyloprofundus sp.]|nr:hypothetical protein [Methyloprofundus sp.]
MKRINLNNIYRVACLSAYALLTACSQNIFQLGQAPQTAEFTNLSQTFAYECQGGYQFTASIDNQQAWLFLPERTVALMHISAASGMKYSGERVMFWSKGKEAMLEIDSTIHKGCKNNRSKAIWEHAKLNGADFRALGNEPSWVLEIIAGEKITFSQPLVAKRFEFTLPEPKVNQSARTTQYDTKDNEHTLSLVINGKPCNDTMSGESFASTVIVILDGNTFNGCGKALH